jgi:signal transduction histidine kinase
MKARPLGNKQKQLRDEATCLASEGLQAVRNLTRANRPSPTREELLQALTDNTIRFFDIIQTLNQMDTIESE